MILTAKLNDGSRVLAKRTKYGVSAYTFANLTQARYRLAAVRAELRAEGYYNESIGGRRPYFIYLPNRNGDPYVNVEYN